MDVGKQLPVHPIIEGNYPCLETRPTQMAVCLRLRGHLGEHRWYGEEDVRAKAAREYAKTYDLLYDSTRIR